MMKLKSGVFESNGNSLRPDFAVFDLSGPKTDPVFSPAQPVKSYSGLTNELSLASTSHVRDVKQTEHSFEGNDLLKWHYGGEFGDLALNNTSPPIVSRSNFLISDFGIYYGEVNTTGGASIDVIQNWNIDTLVVANRRAVNGLGADTFWASQEMQSLKSTPFQDVFAYVNVSKIDRNLSTYQTAGAGNSWFGSSTGVPSEDNVFHANFWDPAWLTVLKTEVEIAIQAGADGLFLDDILGYFNLQTVNGRSAGTNARDMMTLVNELATYARDSARGGNEFRIIVNGGPYIRNDASDPRFGGSAANEGIATSYVSSIDAIAQEFMFNGSSFNFQVASLLSFEYRQKGKQVVVIDDMRTDTGANSTPISNGGSVLADAAAGFEFMPSYAQDGMVFTSAPRLQGSGTNRASQSGDILVGTRLRDELKGLGGSDDLRALEGDDILNGGAGADKLDGGRGFDYASFATSTAGITFFLGGGSANTGEAAGDTLTEIEGLIGSDFGDVIGAGSGTNVITSILGQGGNDWLFGGTGQDTLQGGNGNDILSGGINADRLEGGADIDVAFYRDATSAVSGSLLTGGTAGEAAGDTYFDVENIWGSRFDDVLVGNNGAGQVYGFEGNDNLSGLDGDDFFYGGQGFDTLTGGAGVDNFFLLSWRDQVNAFGTPEPFEGGDTYTDFTSGTDRIILSRFWFGFGNIQGPAAALTETHANFVTNGAAATSRPSLIWNTSNRTLLFDPDGTGSTQSVLIGTFQQGASLALSDIWTA